MSAIIRPEPAETGSTTERIVDLLRSRHHVGFAKYGVAADRKDLTADQWCQHHLEELADALVYTFRQRDEMTALREKNRRLKTEGDFLSARVKELEDMLRDATIVRQPEVEG